VVIALQVLGLFALAVVDLLLVVVTVRNIRSLRREVQADAQASRRADLVAIDSIADLFQEVG